MKKLLILSLAMFLPWAASAEQELSFSELEELPVQADGRKKPFYTFAVETVQILSGRNRFEEPATGERWSPMRTATDLWLNPEGWISQPIVLVDHRPYKESVALDPDRRLFSYEELATNEAFVETLREVQAIEAEDPEADLNRLQREAKDVGSRVAQLERLISGERFAVVPHPTETYGRWVPVSGILTHYDEATALPAARAFEQVREAYLQGDAARFSEASSALRQSLEQLSPAVYPSERAIGLELFYQKFHPFRWAWIAYAMAGLILMATSTYGRQWGYQSAWALAGLGMVLQITGFVLRSVIAGRAPVTNMYETVVWVAFGVVLFALILEAIHRCRYFLLAATPLAVLSLILADTQPAILDSSLQPLAAVLRNNFWLTTHVLTICLSYAAFLLALGVANIIIGKVIFIRRPKIPPELFTYLYRTLQVGVLLLAIGTVLGAFWANYSWGRFWDWDPKETWALVALLSYLAILHGRLAGWWAGFGLAVGSVLAFQTILMAWYGVNFVLGAGLHSYGFGTGGIEYVAGFVIVQVLFATVGLVAWKLKGPGARRRESKSTKDAPATSAVPVAEGGE